MFKIWFFVLSILNLISKIKSLNDGKPQLLAISVPKFEENQEVRLACDVKDGRFPINFEWILNDEKLQTSNNILIKNRDDESRLIIKSLSIEHLGTLRCVAINDLGQDSKTVNLFFNAKPKWIQEPAEKQKHPLFAQVNVICDLTGSPPPKIFWSFLNDDDSIVQRFDTNILSINLTKNSIGRYKCTGQNSAGALEKIINLNYYESV